MMRAVVAFVVVLFALTLFGVAGGVAYQVGLSVASGAGAGVGAAGTPAVAAYPYAWHPFAFGFFPMFGWLVPLLFIFLIVAMASAFARGGHHWKYDRSRMFEEWHREAHARDAGKGDA